MILLIIQATRREKGQHLANLGSCLTIRQFLNCAMQHGDWRRRVAALLGRFLPKLGLLATAALFLRCSVLMTSGEH